MHFCYTIQGRRAVETPARHPNILHSREEAWSTCWWPRFAPSVRIRPILMTWSMAQSPHRAPSKTEGGFAAMALSTLAGFRPGVVFFYLSKRFFFLTILKWERPDKADSRKKSPKRCRQAWTAPDCAYSTKKSPGRKWWDLIREASRQRRLSSF